MPSRRSILRTLSVAPAMVASPTIHAGPSGGLAHDPPWWLVKPLEQGSLLGEKWRLDEVGPIFEGAAILQLSHPSQGELRIHLCLHEGRPKGYAHTELFDLIVIDHGKGVRRVPSDLAPVLTKLADTIQENELTNNSAFGDVADMMTHTERVNAFGASQIQ